MARRGKKYIEAKQKVPQEIVSLEEGIELATQTSTTSFDASVELHMVFGIDVSKGDQIVRGTVTLPHGTGKTTRVAVFVGDDLQKEVKASGADLVGGQELIDEIQKSGKCDFDIAVATPEMMRFVGKIAKILGPKGLMPSPKNETVTSDPVKVVAELKAGKVSFRNDEGANVHQSIGKVSFGKEKLLENALGFVEAINRVKPTSSKGVYIKRAFIASSMGPSIKVKI